jgi:hypothetical protein
MYLKYHKAGLTPTTPVTSIAISPVKMSIGRKSLTNLRSEMILLQGKPVFYIFLPSTLPYWQIILRFCWQWTPKRQQSESRSRATYFRLSVVLGFEVTGVVGVSPALWYFRYIASIFLTLHKRLCYKVQFCAFKGDAQNLPLRRVGRGEISPLAVPRG